MRDRLPKGFAAPLPLLAGPLLLLAVAAAGLGGCLEAETLGGAPPDEVSVGDPPTWGNGVGELMQLKCGVCHRVPRAAVSPASIPDTFDLNHQVESPSGVPGAVSIISFLQEGILREGASPRMPLEQATPLSEAETQALEAWDGS